MMPARARWARRGAYLPGGPTMSAAQIAWLDELLADAARSPRPTLWERDFLASIAGQRRRGGDALGLSENQLAALRRIEEKIHAAG